MVKVLKWVRWVALLPCCVVVAGACSLLRIPSGIAFFHPHNLRKFRPYPRRPACLFRTTHSAPALRSSLGIRFPYCLEPRTLPVGWFAVGAGNRDDRRYFAFLVSRQWANQTCPHLSQVHSSTSAFCRISSRSPKTTRRPRFRYRATDLLGRWSGNALNRAET